VPPDDFEAFVAAITRARRLDRRHVRRSGRERLLIDGSAEGYERALREVAA